MPRKSRHTRIPVPRGHNPAALTAQTMAAAMKSAEMLSSAAVTIGLRTSAMGAAWGGWGRHDPAENTRMVTEKMAAANESAMAGARGLLALQAEGMKMWTKGASAWGGLFAAGLRGYGGMLTPYHTRTKANAKRLGRKRR